MKPKLILTTQSGQSIADVRHVRSDQIHLEDISYGLSQICRWSGQYGSFYSVAAHSILVSEWIATNGGTALDALCGLFHDASEAYITDLPSPVKIHCPEYIKIEAGFMKAICQRFSLPQKFSPIVKEADLALRVIEREHFFAPSDMPWSNKNCQSEFIRRYRELDKLTESRYNEVRR